MVVCLFGLGFALFISWVSDLGSRFEAHAFCWLLLDKIIGRPILFALDFLIGPGRCWPKQIKEMAQCFGPLGNQKTFLQISP